MRHLLLVSEFLATPWAIERERLATISLVVARWAHGTPRAMDDYDYDPAHAAAREARRQQADSIGGGVAVIPVYGALMQRANLMSEFSGGTSTQLLSAQLANALADESVASILLDIDSP